MKTSFRVILVAAVLLAPLAAAHGQQVADPRVADIVRTGKVRVGMHLPQFVKDPATGEIHGNGTGAVIEPVARAWRHGLASPWSWSVIPRPRR